AAIVVIAALTTGEVDTRTLFATPLGWTVGFVEQYLMMAVAFFGTGAAYRTGAHVAVVRLFEEAPEPVRRLLIALAYLIILVGLALLIYSGTRAAHFSFITDEMPPPGMAELPWPTWWWKTIIPVAAALGCVVVLIDLYRELTAPLTRVVTEYEPCLSVEGA